MNSVKKNEKQRKQSTCNNSLLVELFFFPSNIADVFVSIANFLSFTSLKNSL